MNDARSNPTTRPYALRVEHLVAPLGIGAETPRLSWKPAVGAAKQHAYRIIAGDWDSGRVKSTEATFVAVDVAPASGLSVTWKVKTWSDQGESE